MTTSSFTPDVSFKPKACNRVLEGGELVSKQLNEARKTQSEDAFISAVEMWDEESQTPVRKNKPGLAKPTPPSRGGRFNELAESLAAVLGMTAKVVSDNSLVVEEISKIHRESLESLNNYSIQMEGQLREEITTLNEVRENLEKAGKAAQTSMWIQVGLTAFALVAGLCTLGLGTAASVGARAAATAATAASTAGRTATGAAGAAAGAGASATTTSGITAAQVASAIGGPVGQAGFALGGGVIMASLSYVQHKYTDAVEGGQRQLVAINENLANNAEIYNLSRGKVQADEAAISRQTKLVEEQAVDGHQKIMDTITQLLRTLKKAATTISHSVRG